MVLKGEESKLRQPPLTGAPVHASPWQRKSYGKWYHMTDNILWRRTSHDRGRPVSDDNQWQMRVAWQITSHNRGHPMTEDVPSKRMFPWQKTSCDRWYPMSEDIQWQMISWTKGHPMADGIHGRGRPMADGIPWQRAFHGNGTHTVRSGRFRRDKASGWPLLIPDPSCSN